MSIFITGSSLLPMNSPVPIKLKDLADVSIASPVNGQYLRYNSVLAEWQNATLTSDLYSSIETMIVSDGSGTNVTPVSGPNLISIGLTETGVIPGTYSRANLTVDAQGRVVYATDGSSDISYTGIIDALGYTPVNKAGDTMGGPLYLVGTPTTSTEAVTKQYVDNLVTGLLWKTPAILATTGNISLSGVQTIDGVLANVGDRVLVKNQTTTLENGVYVVSSGAWGRATDFDGDPDTGEVNGAAIFVKKGIANADTAWTQTNEVATVGVDPMIFVLFSSSTNNSVLRTGDTMTGDLLMAANIVPTTDSVRDLGSSSNKWSSVFVSTITSGTNSTLLSSSGSTVQVTPGANWNQVSFHTAGAERLRITSAGTIQFQKNYVESTYSVTSSTTTSIDCSQSNNFIVTLASDITTLNFVNVPSAGVVYNATLFLKQDVAGSRVITWPISVKWGLVGAPVLSTGANTTDVVTLTTYDGGTTWLAFTAGTGF
jgi:hypothetical protein